MLQLFLENEQQPKVDVGRTKISAMQLSTVSVICALFHQIDVQVELLFETRFNHSLAELRELCKTPLGSWLSCVLNCDILDPMEASSLLHKMEYVISTGEFLNELGIILAECDGNKVLNDFILANIQDTYEPAIDYMQEQSIALSSQHNGKLITLYDLFPPIMFCKAKDDNSRQYLCGKDAKTRKGITADHPYTIWLLSNATVLSRHFNRQFRQIVNSLCNENADVLIQTINTIRDQLRPISGTYGLDMDLCPKLTNDDFR